jgi:CDP-ribitol ribitolphosphotransferase
VHRIVVESMTWERVWITLQCRVEGISPADCLFYLEDVRTWQRTPVDRITLDGDRFTVKLNSMQAIGQYPLTTGHWGLWAECPELPERLPALMARPFDIDASKNSGVFDVPRARYWIVPTRDTITDQFRFSVNYRWNSIVPPCDGDGPARPTVLQWLKRRFRRFRNLVYRGLFRTLQLLTRRTGRTVLFTSDSRDHLSGNLKHIHKRMVERGLDREYRLLEMFKPSIKAKRPFFDKFRFTYYLAVADVIICDDYHPMLYKVTFPDDVVIIQVWHASGAFKTLGYSRVGKPGGPEPFSNQHKIYTWAIVASQHDVPFYAEGFGLPEERVAPIGIPRLDVFFDEKYIARRRKKTYKEMPGIVGKEVILFAPTFRGSGPANAYYDYEQLDLPALYDLCTERDAVVVLKFHPMVIEPLEIPEQFTDRLFDASAIREINDLLLVSDLVITDYSSLVFEYSTLNRPMLFFAYDLEEYMAERDFYEPFEQFVPGRIVRTFSELLDAIRTGEYEAEKVPMFAREHLGHLDSGSTDRVIDQLILGNGPVPNGNGNGSSA